MVCVCKCAVYVYRERVGDSASVAVYMILGGWVIGGGDFGPIGIDRRIVMIGGKL